MGLLPSNYNVTVSGIVINSNVDPVLHMNCKNVPIIGSSFTTKYKLLFFIFILTI